MAGRLIVRAGSPLGPSVSTTPGACPWCGHHLDMATGVGTDKLPRPGDRSICIGCGAVCVFEADLTLRRADAVETMQVYNRHPQAFQAWEETVGRRARRTREGFRQPRK